MLTKESSGTSSSVSLSGMAAVAGDGSCASGTTYGDAEMWAARHDEGVGLVHNVACQFHTA